MESLYSAAMAHLSRKSPGDAEAAIRLLEKAHSLGLDSAELHQYMGVAYLMAGRIEDAIDACQAAIVRKSDYAEAYHHLAVAERNKGNLEEARRCLNRALEIEPTYFRALHGLAVLEAEAGRLPEAEALFRKAIEQRPSLPVARQGLGMVLQKMGRQNEAALAFIEAVRAGNMPAANPTPPRAPAAAIADLEKKLSLSPEAATLHFQLAKQIPIAPPAQVPAQSVAGLFDRYADLFDEHLRGKLGYKAPELIVDAIVATHPKQPLDVLDLGCGTGLCGPLLRPMARTLVGVDLSPAMIEKARERGIYDRLEAGDIVQIMHQSPRAFDLLVAADVLMYLGDLGPTFEAATLSLRPNGVFAFSLEASQADRFHFNQQTHRYSHSKNYLKHLAGIYGFEELCFDTITVRQEAGKPVEAYRVVLRLPA